MSVLLFHCGCLSHCSSSTDSIDSTWCSAKEDGESVTLATNSMKEDESCTLVTNYKYDSESRTLVTKHMEDDSESCTLATNLIHEEVEDSETRKIIEQIASKTWYVASIAAAEEKSQPPNQQPHETELSDSRDSNEYRQISSKMDDPISEIRDEIADNRSMVSEQYSTGSSQETTRRETTRRDIKEINPTDNHSPALRVEDERDVTKVEASVQAAEQASEQAAETNHQEALEMVLGRRSPLRPHSPSGTATDVVLQVDDYEMDFGGKPTSNQNGATMSSPHLFAFNYFKKHCGADSVGARSNLRQFERKVASSNSLIVQPERKKLPLSSITHRTTAKINLRSKAEVDKAREKILSSTAFRKNRPIIGPQQRPNTLKPTELPVICKLEGSDKAKDITFNPNKTTFDLLTKDIAHKSFENQSTVPGGYVFRESKDGVSVLIEDLCKLEDGDQDHLTFVSAGSLTSPGLLPDGGKDCPTSTTSTTTSQDELRTPAPEDDNNNNNNNNNNKKEMMVREGCSSAERTAEEDAIVSNAAAGGSVSATAAAAAVSYLSRKKMSRNSIPKRPKRMTLPPPPPPRTTQEEGAETQLESREPSPS